MYTPKSFLRLSLLMGLVLLSTWNAPYQSAGLFSAFYLDDIPGVTVTPTSGLITSEDGASDTITVVLNSQPSDDVDLRFSSSDPAEGSVSSNKLTFTNQNWDVPQTVTITGVDDISVDGDVGYTILIKLTSKDKSYQPIEPPDAAAVNLDNDVYPPPTAIDDSYSLNQNSTLSVQAPGVLINDQTPAGSPALTAQHISGPTSGNLILNSDGSFTYTPNLGFSGQDSFTYQAVSGGQASNTASVNLTVSVANQPPQAVDDAYSINQDTTLTVSADKGVLNNDTDPNADPLTARLLTQTSHGQLAISQDGAFTYTPFASYTGSDEFTYVANDGKTDSAAATARITVISVNQPPVAQADSYLTNDQLVVSADSGLLKNDSDPDGGAIAVSSYSQPSHGSVFVSANGAFTYSPASDFEGTDSFSYTINDGLAFSAPSTVTIRVDITPPVPVSWVQPVTDGQIKTVSNQIITLEVLLSPVPDDLEGILFYRWDPDLSKRVVLGGQPTAPYRVQITTSGLKVGWNQIDATALDKAGNHSPYQHIWIFRLNSIYLPVLQNR